MLSHERSITPHLMCWTLCRMNDIFLTWFRKIVGSSPDRVKPKTIKLVCVASPLRLVGSESGTCVLMGDMSIIVSNWEIYYTPFNVLNVLSHEWHIFNLIQKDKIILKSLMYISCRNWHGNMNRGLEPSCKHHNTNPILLDTEVYSIQQYVIKFVSDLQ
jgi:hypothetical protein